MFLNRYLNVIIMYLPKHISEEIPFLFSNLDDQLECITGLNTIQQWLDISYYYTVDDEQTISA